MANIQVLSSLDAPELDVYARLTQAQLRNRLEPEKGVFIAESPKVIRTALDAGLSPVSFLMEQRHIGGDAAPLLARFPDIPVYTADRDILAGLTGYTLTRGVLCAMRRPAPTAHCGFRECSGRDEHRSDLPLGSGAGHGRSAAYLHVLRSVDPARGAREHGHRVPDSMGCAGRLVASASRRLFHLCDGAARRFNCAGRRQAFRSSEACHCPRRGGRRACRLYYRRLRLHCPYPHGARRGFSQRRSGKRGCILGTSLPKGLNQAFRKRIRLDCAHNFAPMAQNSTLARR